MRLIDADVLLRETLYNPTHTPFIHEKDVANTPTIEAVPISIIDDIKAEIEGVKAVMNEEIIEHNRTDLINFVNGLNQCLGIIDSNICRNDFVDFVSGKEKE